MSVSLDETIVGVSIRRIDLGAVGDGVTDDAPAFANLAGSTLIDPDELLIIPKGTYRIASAQTITHPVYFQHGAVLKPDAGVTVTLARSFEAGITPIFDGDGTIAIIPGAVAEAYPQWWGAVGDGTTDAGPAVLRAANTLAASGGELVFPGGFYRFAASDTIPHPIHILPGAELRPAAGVTLTLTEVSAPFTQVFGGEGRVLIGRGRVAEAYPQWWGAVGDGGVDDGPAIARAVEAMAASQGALVFPPGAYLVGEDLTLEYPVRLAPGASLRPDFGVTLTLTGVEAPLQRVFAGAGTVTFAPGRGSGAYPQWWGAVADGAVDDAPAVAKAAAAVEVSGGELVFTGGAYRFVTSQTVPVPVRVLRGAELRPDPDTTLTLGGIDAGIQCIFTGEGTVRFTPGTVAEAYPQWWGAVGDGVQEDGTAMAAASDALAAAGGELLFPAGTYRVAGSRTLDAPVRLLRGAELHPDADSTLTLTGITAPLRRVFGGEGTVAFQVGTVVDAYPQWWGALGDGAGDDAPAVAAAAAALAASGGVLVFPGGAYRFSATATLAAPVRLLRGAELRPDAGVTLTLAGIDAPLAKIFGGAGTVAFAVAKSVEVLPQWWGAVGDGTADDAPAFRLASAALTASGGGRLFVPLGTYLFDSGELGVTGTSAGFIVGVDGVHVEGAGPGSVIQAGPGLDAVGDNSNFLLELQGDLLAPYAAARRDLTVSNLRFVGRGVTFPYPSGVHGAPYSEGLRVVDCEFENLGMYGGTDHSSSWNGLVSGCVSRGCAVAHQISGTTITHTVLITDNRMINCWNAVTAQFGAACTISDNAVFFDGGYANAPASYMITSAILVMGQKGCVVKGNTIDARKANAAGGVVVPVGIQVGGNYGTADDLTYGYGRSCVVSDNVVLGPVTTAILLAGAQQCTLSGNQLGDATSPNRPTFGITLRENAATGQKSLRNQVFGNTIYVYTSAGAGIYEVEAKTGDNDIHGNDVVSAPVAGFILVNATAPVSRIFQNRGYVTEASGEASIAAAATSVTVNPGISETLVRRYIRLTPINSLNAAVKFRVANVTATTFDIAVDVAPGLSGASFAWAYNKV